MAAVLRTGDYAAGREETVTMREGMEVITALNHPEPKSSSAGLAVARMCLNLCPVLEPTQNRFFHEV